MKQFLFWFSAIIITCSAVIYQRKTGPTYDKKGEITIDEQLIEYALVRSHGEETDAVVEITVQDDKITGEIKYRKYPTTNVWTTIKMQRNKNLMTGRLPQLPPAGKYEYVVTLSKNGKSHTLNDGEPVVIRFKGAVPNGVLIPHVILMFVAMLLGNLAGIMAVFKHKKFKFYTLLTLVTLFLGGLILGPWVQWYAFGEAWAGVPFAWDLTDNKTLVAFIFWFMAFILNRKKERPAMVILAALVMLAVYSIPHSMYGSELDPETGEIIQGWIQIYFM
jgi:hypothetical protein